MCVNTTMWCIGKVGGATVLAQRSTQQALQNFPGILFLVVVVILPSKLRRVTSPAPLGKCENKKRGNLRPARESIGITFISDRRARFRTTCENVHFLAHPERIGRTSPPYSSHSVARKLAKPLRKMFALNLTPVL